MFRVDFLKLYIVIICLLLFSGCIVKDAVMLPVDVATTAVSVGATVGGAVVSAGGTVVDMASDKEDEEQ